MKINLRILSMGVMGFGDWGLGIGDWAQSPIPNPDKNYLYIKIKKYFNNNKYVYNSIY